MSLSALCLLMQTAQAEFIGRQLIMMLSLRNTSSLNCLHTETRNRNVLRGKPRQNHPSPNAASTGRRPGSSWFPNSVIPEASALAAHREKGRKHDCTSLLTNPERVIPGSGSPQDAMLVSSTGRAPVAPLGACWLPALFFVAGG